ncbi:MAG: hypothetical protein PHT07_00890 [Paludibacter sp.]|nr:hypothetical protein [Paludibacter sp.]
METNQQSTKEFFKLASFIHLGLILGVVLFGMIVYFFLADFQHVDTTTEFPKLLVYLVPGLVVVGIVASNMMYRIRLNEVKERGDLKTKMQGYRESLIIRYMLLEGPALFALVAVFRTNNSSFMVYAGLMVVLMALKRPTLKSAIADLDLDQQEIALLEDPDARVL